MVVNSFAFLFFFVIVFSVYYLPVTRKNSLCQNLWLLLASYFFYGYADVKMIPLLFGATIAFYVLGKYLKRAMEQNHWNLASHLTTFGVCLGVGILLYFKYLNFFAESFAEVLNAIGLNVTWTTLNIVLPIGVSFFVFKLISYIIEIHRERVVPSKKFVDFALYVSFFPTILSGPIDRPNKFLPQLREYRELLYENVSAGFKMIIWGWFMKVCVADRLALYTDAVFNNYEHHSGITLIVAALIYPMQMYADFAGYSDMAIGVGKILGLKITENFKRPFFAQNISEYWNRWHMSLTSWITDYVFMPLNIAFRDWGKMGIMLAVMINLVVIGFWHGANWTYGVFGLYHGLLFMPLILSGKFGKKAKIKPCHTYFLPLSVIFKIFVTYLCVSIGLVIFRSPDFMSALGYLHNIFTAKGNMMIDIPTLAYGLLSLSILWFKDYKDELKIKASFMHSNLKIMSYCSCVLIVAYILLCGVLNGGQFIYFQF